jgi:hypothetical protein
MSVESNTAARPRNVDLIARLHAGHAADHALAGVLNGRTVALRGVTSEEVETLGAALVECGARVVRVLLPGVAALVVGSRPMAEDLAQAARRGIAVLSSRAIAAIRSAHHRVVARERDQIHAASVRALTRTRWSKVERRMSGGMRLTPEEVAAAKAARRARADAAAVATSGTRMRALA